MGLLVRRSMHAHESLLICCPSLQQVAFAHCQCRVCVRQYVQALKQELRSFLVHPEVVAVGSRSQEKADAYIKEVEGAEGAVGYGSYEDVLEDKNVCAVYIPLPTSMHLKWVQAAAAKGKHILLEKPIAMV